MKGWIIGHKDSIHKLEEIGIECPDHWKVGQPAHGEGMIEWKKCTITDEQFELLHDLWGEFIWHLE